MIFHPVFNVKTYFSLSRLLILEDNRQIFKLSTADRTVGRCKVGASIVDSV